MSPFICYLIATQSLFVAARQLISQPFSFVTSSLPSNSTSFFWNPTFLSITSLAAAAAVFLLWWIGASFLHPNEKILLRTHDASRFAQRMRPTPRFCFGVPLPCSQPFHTPIKLDALPKKCQRAIVGVSKSDPSFLKLWKHSCKEFLQNQPEDLLQFHSKCQKCFRQLLDKSNDQERPG